MKRLILIATILLLSTGFIFSLGLAHFIFGPTSVKLEPGTPSSGNVETPQEVTKE